ncbi:TetR/AcrR family transcriptional regulator [uncultured Tateyamaria sp.]|uniref:TetR/AcrR family transcriptional regulator n=1 Tax=uncultured Tateyamaria sp. TaxID=455651 RepID=UPI0026120FE9|nr:TetR/AcrR family transcriptional regulator [uncultured Tateyamaria sp.]
MADPDTRPLKERVVSEAFKVIAEAGVEALSLRAIAKRLGVSHQAPYKHFPSRDHILAEVVARSFETFSTHLEARPRSENGFEDLGFMGRAYLDFAMTHPLQYRLMFNTALPDIDDHPNMLAMSQRAFFILHERLQTIALSDPGGSIDQPAKHDAMFIWATLHGCCSILNSDVAKTLALTDQEKANTMDRMMRRLSMALGAIEADSCN